MKKKQQQSRNAAALAKKTPRPEREPLVLPNHQMASNDGKPALPKGWVWARIEDACIDLIGGGTPSREITEYFGGNIIWLTPTEIPKQKVVILQDSKERISEAGLKHSSARLIPPGAVLLTSRASIGYVAIAGREVTTNQGFASFVCSNCVYNFYLAYWLWSSKQLLESHATGTTFKEISKAKLREFSFPLPPLPEQHRIVAKIEELFTKLDAGVAELKKAKAQLQRYRQSVLKDAFAGKLTQTWREAHKHELEPAAALLERIKEERKKNAKGKYKEPPPVDASSLPELPEGWVWTKLEAICLIQGGYAFKSGDYRKSGVPLLRISNINNLQVSFKKDTVYLDSTLLKTFEEYEVSRDDILVALSGATTGKYGVYRIDDVALLNQRVGRLKFFSLSEEITNYVFHYLEIIRFQILKQAYGAAQPNISTNELSAFVIPLPSNMERREIISEIERRFSITEEVEKVIDQSLKQAERLRQSILQRAFAGKLVAQDPNDEPAEKLLERIKAEKAKREVDGKVKSR